MGFVPLAHVLSPSAIASGSKCVTMKHMPRMLAASGAALAAWSFRKVQCHQANSFVHLDDLWQTIMERKASGDASRSWTSRLLAKGSDKCAQKVGEEATEVCIEAAARRAEGVVKESADLIFHLLVLWASLGIDPKEVLEELARRQGVSGVEEKASRPR